MGEEIRFTRPRPDACPQHKDYYIRERWSGYDIHGNETYDYALFQRVQFKFVRKFHRRKQAYEFLAKVAHITKFDVEQGSHRVITNTHEMIGIIGGSMMYRLNKRTRVLETRPIDDEQVTVWHMTYRDCLMDAKITIAARERAFALELFPNV